MVGQHAILFGDGQVGVAHVTKEGLFYKISCRCDISRDVPARIEALWQDLRIDLGLCVRMGEGMGLVARIGAKKVPSYAPVFRIIIKRRNEVGRFVPIRPEEPFHYLQRLKDAWLVRCDEEIGIMLPDL